MHAHNRTIRRDGVDRGFGRAVSQLLHFAFEPGSSRSSILQKVLATQSPLVEQLIKVLLLHLRVAHQVYAEDGFQAFHIASFQGVRFTRQGLTQ